MMGNEEHGLNMDWGMRRMLLVKAEVFYLLQSINNPVLYKANFYA